MKPLERTLPALVFTTDASDRLRFPIKSRGCTLSLGGGASLVSLDDGRGLLSRELKCPGRGLCTDIGRAFGRNSAIARRVIATDRAWGPRQQGK